MRLLSPLPTLTAIMPHTHFTPVSVILPVIFTGDIECHPPHRHTLPPQPHASACVITFQLQYSLQPCPRLSVADIPHSAHATTLSELTEGPASPSRSHHLCCSGHPRHVRGSGRTSCPLSCTHASSRHPHRLRRPLLPHRHHAAPQEECSYASAADCLSPHSHC